jgi:hypothetical protein
VHRVHSANVVATSLEPQSRQSSELGFPQPLTRRRVCPPSPALVPREGHTRWRERGWESPNSDEGTYTVVLFIYMNFVTGTNRGEGVGWGDEEGQSDIYL